MTNATQFELNEQVRQVSGFRLKFDRPYQTGRVCEILYSGEGSGAVRVEYADGYRNLLKPEWLEKILKPRSTAQRNPFIKYDVDKYARPSLY